MELLDLGINVLELMGLLAMVSSVFFFKKGVWPSFNPKKWFPRGGTKEIYRSPGHLLWNWGFGLFIFSFLAGLALKNRFGENATNFLAPHVVILIVMVVGFVEVAVSLFFISPGQEILPGDVGGGRAVRPMRGLFKHPGYLLARNGAILVVLGGVTLTLMEVL